MMLGWVLALLAASAVVGMAGRSRVAREPARVATPTAWLLAATGAALATIAGAQGLAGDPTALSLGGLGGLGAASLRVDRLSGLFLVISFGVAVPALLAAASQGRDRPRLPALVATTLAGVLVVLTADHVFVLLLGWELVTLTFYLLTAYDRRLAGRGRASVAAAVFGKASGAALLLGALMLAGQAHGFTLSGLGTARAGGIGDLAYALLLLGFAAKVGIVPLQVWLPPAYASAPPAARAVMAGVAVNIGFYGMWRTLQVLGPPPVWLVAVVLVAAGLTAILGISHAAAHPEITGLVAWSSVENAGIITAGFGVALEGAVSGSRQLMAAGLLAATAQVIAHSLGKALLFTAAARIEDITGTTQLDRLRGIVQRDRWAGAGLVIGALTLAGLPLTAGFASEWLTLEALMQQFRVASLPMQLASAVAGALVALTVGVAGVTFVRLVALTAYGRPSTPLQPTAAGPGAGYRLGVALLAAACLGTAALAPLEVHLISAGLAPLVGGTADRAVTGTWVLQPVYANFSVLSPSWLWIVLPALTGLVLAMAWGFSNGRVWRVRRVDPWSSASPGVDRSVGYTSFGYANPIRKVLANILLTRTQVHQVEADEAREAADHAHLVDQARRGVSAVTDPGWEGGEVTKRYELDVVELVEEYLYLPLGRLLMMVVRQAKRLQSGRLDAYLMYMLVVLLAVLALVSGLS